MEQVIVLPKNIYFKFKSYLKTRLKFKINMWPTFTKNLTSWRSLLCIRSHWKPI